MKNKRDATTLMVIAKCDLKTDGNKRLLFTKQKEKNDEDIP